MNVMKLNKKIIAGFFVIFVLTVIVVGQVLFRQPSTPTKNIQRLVLNNFANQRYGEYFTVANDIDITTANNNNKSYKAMGLSKNYENIKIAAFKLGLSNESKNINTGITKWTKQGVNDIRGDYVYLDERSGYVRVMYANGINENSLENNEYMKFIIGFFGLPEYEVFTLNRNVQENVEVITYGVKWRGFNVYFNNADKIYSTVVASSGKIVNLFFYILPFEFVDYIDLEPVEKVTKENLRLHYYQIALELEGFSSASNLGSEVMVDPPVKVGFRDQKEAYIYFYDKNQAWLLVPVLDINGVFTDSTGQRGKANLLIVNQKF